MSPKGLFIWVEGSEDRRFFDKIITPHFQGKYDFVKIREWSQTKPKTVCKIIKTFYNNGHDYILVADFDGFQSITQKKEKIKEKCDLDPNKIIIVKTEIESWYLAGLDKDGCKTFRIKPIKNTETIQKQRFMELIPKRYDEVMFRIEILNNYCLETAKRQNESFKYFVNKYGICIS